MRSARQSGLARAIGLFVAFSPLACSPNSVEADDVLSLDCSNRCEALADGQSAVTLRACTPVAERRRDLSVRFTTTVGTWRMPKAGEPAVSEVSLGRNACVTADWVPSQSPGPARIVAELGGFQQEVVLQVAPVGVGRLEVTAQPALLEAKTATTVIVNAVVRATSGSPSNGTTVSFLIGEREPATAHAVVFPSSVRADADGLASATVTVASGTRSLILQVEADPHGATGLGTELSLFAEGGGEGGAPPD
jgi:hypothetical protein